MFYTQGSIVVILDVLFIISLFGIGYSYFIYPMILLAIKNLDSSTSSICHLEPSPSAPSPHNLPTMSFIITAFNEEAQIASKLDNTLLAGYPKEKLEIIVASDGSTDQTNDIVTSYQNRGIILHHVKERKGKENAQKSAIQIANGEILVFSDVSTQIEKEALHQIAVRFEDSCVGAVSSEDRFLTQDGEIAGEGAYVKYEMWLRKLESDVKSLVGLSGSFFAARKGVCQDWSIDIPSDFNTALNCVKNGYKAVTAPELLGYYPNLKDATKEYQRKVRTVIRGMAALFSQAYIMNPFKYKLFAFQVTSHKLMRWLVPYFLILSFVTNFYLVDSSLLYLGAFMTQCLFYTLAILAYGAEILRKSALVKIIYFFVQVNIAIFHASIMFLFGKRVILWEPSKR